MKGWLNAALTIVQILLLLAYLPMATGLWMLAYEHVSYDVFSALPTQLAMALVPIVVALSPLLYAGFRAQARAGAVCLFLVAWCIVSTACWVIVDPAFNDLFVSPTPFAPVGWPILLIEAAGEAPSIGLPSLIVAAFTGVVTLRLGARFRRGRLAAAAAPVMAAVLGWMAAEALFSWQMPASARAQFGRDYCLTGLGSATQSLRYGVGLSMYRHAESTDKETRYHWSFKAGKFVPEDHWGTSGYVWQRTCPAGSHLAKDARRM